MDEAADGFGGLKRERAFLTFGSSTHMPLPTDSLRCQPHTRSTNRRKNASTFSAFEMLRTVHSPLWSSPPLVEWLGRPPSLQTSCLSLGREVEPALQYHNGVAALYPVLLSAQILHPLSAWLPFIPWSGHKSRKLLFSRCSPGGESLVICKITAT